jgi:hypothetical protein
MNPQTAKRNTLPRRPTAQSNNPPVSATAEPGTPPAGGAARTRIKVKPTHPAAPGKYQALRPVTTIEARIDVGFGNGVFIRGQGDGLSWEKGQPLSCVEASRWVWYSEQARGPVSFKLLLNDERWAQGVDLKVEAGQSLELTPSFA